MLREPLTLPSRWKKMISKLKSKHWKKNKLRLLLADNPQKRNKSHKGITNNNYVEIMPTFCFV